MTNMCGSCGLLAWEDINPTHGVHSLTALENHMEPLKCKRLGSSQIGQWGSQRGGV